MALNFPADATSGDTYTDGTTTWQFDGVAWNVVSAPTSITIPNSFGTFSVAGQNDVVADATNDTLTLIAGTNVTITTDSESDSITINSSASGEGGGEANQNAFSNIAVSGQTTIAADIATDTLNIAGGTGISITTNESTDTLTITNTQSAGATTFATLTDASSASLTIDKIYEPAIAMLRVDNNGTSSYTFASHYGGNNPTIYALSGTTIAFDLSAISGHPFEIQDAIGNPYNTGLVHVATDGTVSTESNAQGKDSGTLYWRVPESISGGYRYQCQNHAAMVGAITLKRLSVI